MFYDCEFCVSLCPQIYSVVILGWWVYEYLIIAATAGNSQRTVFLL